MGMGGRKGKTIVGCDQTTGLEGKNEGKAQRPSENFSWCLGMLVAF